MLNMHDPLCIWMNTGEVNYDAVAFISLLLACWNLADTFGTDQTLIGRSFWEMWENLQPFFSERFEVICYQWLGSI